MSAPRDRLGPPLTRALLAKLLLIACAIAAAKWSDGDARFYGRQHDGTPDAVWILARGFDASAYQGLAEHGYTDAFSRNYPLGYPALVAAARPLAGTYQNAAVLVSNLAGVLAVAVFFLLARRYAAAGAGGAATDAGAGAATLLFACTPGVLAFGSVAYAEAPYMVVSMLGWWAYLAAAGAPPGPAGGAAGSERGAAAAAGPRSAGRLALASLLLGGAVQIKHLGAPVLVALALIEGARVVRARGPDRRRAWIEALAALWTAPLLAAYFLCKFTAHDLSGLQSEIWNMRFLPLGGVPSLIALGTAPEYVAQILCTLPIAAWLALRLRRVDPRLALIAALLLLEALSFTGTAAQSLTRYTWTTWPLALGALGLRERGAVWALCGLLFCVSLWCVSGHVLGTAAF